MIGLPAFILSLSLLVSNFNLYNYDTREYKDMSVNPIILDLDFCGDVDDAVAVRTATILDDMDVCSLKGVCLSVNDPKKSGSEGKALHGLLSNDGYGNIPIGVCSTDHVEEYSSYWDVLIPYSQTTPNSKDAVTLYKEILQKSYNKVTIIVTGYTTNIKKLLEDKEGYALVKSKVEKIVITGGSFQNNWDNNFGYYLGAADAIVYVNKNCPCPVLYSFSDLGNNVKAGQAIIKNSPDDPIAKALVAHGDPDGRFAWDPYAVLIGCFPAGSLPFRYTYVEADINNNGAYTFKRSDKKTNTVAAVKREDITYDQYQAIIEGILGAGYQ